MAGMLCLRPAAQVLIDHCPHLATDIRVAHVAHPLRLDDQIGEAVHILGRRLSKPPDLCRRQAEAQLDAQFVKEPLNLKLQVSRGCMDSMRGGGRYCCTSLLYRPRSRQQRPRPGPLTCGGVGRQGLEP